MWHTFTCEVKTSFKDDEVIEWLMGESDENEDIDWDNYKPTYSDLKNFAWYLIKNDECEYGFIYGG